MTAEIGGLLRKARLKQSLSLRSLAAKVGVSASLISQVETGKTQPSVSTLYALSNYLGLSMDDLLGNDLAPTKSGVATHLKSLAPDDAITLSPAVQRSADNPSSSTPRGRSPSRRSI